MLWAPVQKHLESCQKTPNLLDYTTTVATFSWDAIRSELQGLPEGKGLNIAHEAVDRHADGPLRDRVALRWLGSNGATRDLPMVI